MTHSNHGKVARGLRAGRLITLGLAASTLVWGHRAHADRTWTNGNANGFWSQGGNWSPAEEPNAFTGLTIFPNPIPGGSGDISLGPLEGAGELRFDVGGYNLLGGDLNIFNGNITVNQPSGGNPTITSEIKGFNGLTKLGFGNLNLQGPNSYTGATTVSQGNLDVSGANERIPDSSLVDIAAGTNLRFFLGTGTETIGSLTGSGNVQFGNSDSGFFNVGTRLRIGTDNTSTIFAGNIEDAFGGQGGITKIGTGTLELTGNNTYTRGTTVSGGQLVVDTDSLPVSNGVENNATLTFNQTFDATYSGVISGSGEVVKTGAGVLTLDQTNTHTGGTRIEEGVLSISANANLGANTSPVTFAGGTLRATGGAQVTLPASRPLVTDGADAVLNSQVTGGFGLVVDSDISGDGGLVKTGPGFVILGGGGTNYAGVTTIEQGELSTDASESLPNTTDVTVNGGLLGLQFGVTETIDSLNGVGEVSFDFNPGAHLILGAANGSGTFAGNIGVAFGGDGQLTKIGTGTQTLTGNNSYTEGTTVSGGRLVVDTDSLPAAGGVVNNASLEFNQGFDATYSGVISGSGVLFKTGGGALTLSQSNTVGGLRVEAGDLRLTNGMTVATTTEVSPGATLSIEGGTFTANGGVTVDDGGFDRVSGTFSLSSGQTFTAKNNAQVTFADSYELDDSTDFQINSGADFTVTSYLDVGNDTVGTLIVDGEGTSLTTNSTITTFLDWGLSGGFATVSIKNKATATINATRIDFARSGNTDSVGNLSVLSGATMTANEIRLATNSGGGEGNITVSGENSSLTLNGASILTVGSNGSSSAAVTVEEMGTFTAGTGLTTINDTGTLTVQTGGMFNAPGGITSSGTVQLLGSSITAGGFTNTGGFTHEDGVLTVEGGTFDPGSAGYTINGAEADDLPTVKLVNGATAAVTDTLTVGGTQKGELRVEGGSTFDVGNKLVLGSASGGRGSLFVTGTDSSVTVDDLLIVGVRVGSQGGDITISDGGLLVANGFQIGSGNPGGPVSTLTIDGGTSSASASMNLDFGFSSDATLHLKDGGSAIAGNDVALFSGGLLKGNGIVQANVVRSLGRGVSPGEDGEIGVISIIGDYRQEAGAPLLIDVAAAGGSVAATSDVLEMTGDARLSGGNLIVELLGGNAPDAGDVFTILSAGFIDGAFDNAGDGDRLYTEDGIGSFRVDYDDLLTTITLRDFELFVLGDMDGNGVVDAFDVDDFELALASKVAYQIIHPDLDPDRQGDLNGDGVLDAFDVGPFEFLLAGGPIPEPATGMVGLIGMAGLMTRRRRD